MEISIFQWISILSMDIQSGISSFSRFHVFHLSPSFLSSFIIMLGHPQTEFLGACLICYFEQKTHPVL